jgi:NDP-hexose 4-ketoreductase
MAGRRVLVLGASGFLGRAVTAALDADPRADTVIRAGSRSRDEGPASGGQGWVNCVGKLEGSTEDLAAANTVVVARLLDALAAALPATRLVTVGSAAEYGVVANGVAVDELHPTNPVGGYGVTKLAGTQLVRLAVQQGRVDAVSLRVFNPIGTGLPSESVLGRAAARIRGALEAGADRIELGPLGSYRDFVDVRDVAAAVAAAGLAERVGEPVLNVGSGSAVLVRDAVQRLAELAGFGGRIEESAPAPSRSRSVDWISADLTRIRQVLGWSPSIDLGTSLKSVWAG